MSFKNVWNDVRRDSMGDIVFCSWAGKLDGVIQICLQLVDSEQVSFECVVKVTNFEYNFATRTDYSP